MAKDWIEEEGDAQELDQARQEILSRVQPARATGEIAIVAQRVNGVEEGLSEYAIANKTGGLRDASGRFVPGVVNPSPGRPKKAQEKALLDSIRKSFPPEKVEAYLTTAMRLAEEQNSARGMLAVLEFAASYTLGKPVQRIEMADGGLADMAIELGIDISEE